MDIEVSGADSNIEMLEKSVSQTALDEVNANDGGATDIQLQRTSNQGQTTNVTGTSGFVVTGGTSSVGTMRIGTTISEVSLALGAAASITSPGIINSL